MVGNVQVSTNRGSVAVQHLAGQYDTISLISGQLFGDGGVVYANQSVPDLQLTGWNIMLLGGGGNVLQSNAFPSANQISNVSAFDTHTLYLIYQRPSGGVYVSADVTNIQAVPEPESYALLLAGLGIMGMLARRKQKSAQKK
ncbi:MAG: PEP-CTERM sorting domain-containing protein [Burkholderiales bacterium]|nr:PEP-CTERM sorting domain-containing protein [Burkholderiales bacterium]